MRLLDLFCGRWGWSRAFAKRGWECYGIDLTHPPEVPENCDFWEGDVLEFDIKAIRAFAPHFICASSPCEQFSVHGMKHFHPNPPYPTLGIKLFEHTRRICEESGVPYVMENVRAAQQFVGNAVHHCGPFYLWGTGVPAVLPSGIAKSFKHKEIFAHDRTNRAKASATIPPELANAVADYAERLIEQRSCSSGNTQTLL